LVFGEKARLTPDGSNQEPINMLHLIDPDTGIRSNPNGCWVVEILRWSPHATSTRQRHKPLVERHFHADEATARAAKRAYLERHPHPLTVIVAVRPWLAPIAGGSIR
jgi:hypothetical protein